MSHGRSDLDFEIFLAGDCHAANSIGLEVFPDQFIWIAVGRIGWKKKQPQSAVRLSDKGFRLFRNVCGPPINNQKDRSLGADHQAFEKLDKDRGIHSAFFLDHEPHGPRE